MPIDGQFSQPNTSDLFGSIWYTKNMNFDEQGYAKLSSRAVSLFSEDDDAQFNIITAISRSGLLVTTEEPFKSTITPTSISITEDADSGNPSLAFHSRGVSYHDKWLVTSDTKLYSKTSSTWTDTTGSGTSALTSGVAHPLEVFRNRDSICIGNGNVVKQYTETGGTYTNTVDLTIPSDYEVIGLSYASNSMAVITKLVSNSAGEAYVFLWDGSKTEAESGHPVGSDLVAGIVAYKSSWVILTRSGELKLFNGGGFETLATLPYFFQNITWGSIDSLDMYGGLMVDGDVIYIQVNNKLNNYGLKGENYLEHVPGGVLCYDPKVGLYHRYSPSISSANLITVNSGGADVSSNIFTKASGTLYTTGNPIKYVSNATNPVGGLVINKVYYIIRVDATRFKLALTKDDADAGNAVDVTADAGASSYFLGLNLIDYGASVMDRTGAVGPRSSNSNVADHLIFGGEYFDYDATTAISHLNVTVSGFDNIGYLVSPKLASQGIEDITQKIYVKYKPLKTDDKIIVKYKEKDVIGIPVSTPQNNVGDCTWTSSTTLTTTSNLSEVESYINDEDGECECEIISGSGAGQMAQIASISEAGGTYTITFASPMVGAVNTYRCNVIINNWKLLGEIGSTDTQGFKEFPIAVSSKWFKFKIELRGSNTTIEKFLAISREHLPT